MVWRSHVINGRKECYRYLPITQLKEPSFDLHKAFGQCSFPCKLWLASRIQIIGSMKCICVHIEIVASSLSDKDSVHRGVLPSLWSKRLLPEAKTRLV